MPFLETRKGILGQIFEVTAVSFFTQLYQTAIH